MIRIVPFMNSVSFSAIIMGAGAIASEYDSPSSSEILTHAHALSAHPQFSLTGFYDPDQIKSIEAARKWSTQSFLTLSEVPSNIDVIAVSAPTKVHRACFEEALKLKPRLIILEKPVAFDSAERNAIVAAAQASQISVVVHYTRRFAPGLSELASRIQSNEFGKLQTGNAYYTKGWQNNGSHMMDLLFMLLGTPTRAQSIGCFVDYSSEDLNHHVVINFGEAPVSIFAGREDRYSEFSLSFLFEFAKIEISDFGFRYRIQRVIPDPIFPKYKSLESQGQVITTELDRSVYFLYDRVAEILNCSQPNLEGLKSACETENWLDVVRKGI
ncbi:MAG: Gfo/Idh/MocA family oxidoreductase [Proteobacteria bacterium]|nr:MAG: Gfo/Idh/MocA family oxidoreductase [Pseudomonadota bacterium]